MTDTNSFKYSSTELLLHGRGRRCNLKSLRPFSQQREEVVPRHMDYSACFLLQ